KLVVPGTAIGLVIVVARSTADVFIGASILVAAATGYHIWSMRRIQAARDTRRKYVAAALEALADGLRAGLTPAAAVSHVDKSSQGLLAPVRAAIVMGGNVPDALRNAATKPGAEALDALGSAWQIA